MSFADGCLHAWLCGTSASAAVAVPLAASKPSDAQDSKSAGAAAESKGDAKASAVATSVAAAKADSSAALVPSLAQLCALLNARALADDDEALQAGLELLNAIVGN